MFRRRSAAALSLLLAVPPAFADDAAGKVYTFIDRVIDLESSASVGPNTQEVEPRIRWDIANTVNALPDIPGKRRFIVDVLIVEAATGLGLVAENAIGRALDIERLRRPAERFYEYASEHGPIGWGPIEFKDPNYGDPWINNFGHPACFYGAASYFRKRGYGVGASFAGGMIANVLWEYLWENEEIPKSGHDILYMNLLGSLAGAHPDLGLAWGVSPLRFDDARGHYTEFYYRPHGTVWRIFFRSEPNGHYNLPLPDGREPQKHDKPLLVSDHSIGVANEDAGWTLFVTGVSDTGPREFSDIHGIRDVFDDVRVGGSFDVLSLVRPKRKVSFKHIRP